MAGPTLTVNVAADVRDLVRGIDTSNAKLGELSRTAKSGSGVLKGALGAEAIAGGVRLIGSAVGDAIGTVQQQQDLARQTEAVLKSTGAAAGVSAAGVVELSNAIEGKSKLDAEAITAGQNLLLTFTNIKNTAGAGNDVFNQTTQIMADMATAMGTEPKANAVMLGKALNDPVKGISALSRVGVTFTAQQKEQVAAMQKAGDTAGAQKIILAELNKEFGGSAEASSKTFSGAIFQVKDALAGVLEGALASVMPKLTELGLAFAEKLPGWIDTAKGALSTAATAVQPVIDAVGRFVGFLRDNPDTVKAFAITLGILGGALAVVSAVTAVWNAILLANPIVLIIVGIAALVAAIVYLITHFDQIKAKTAEVWGKMTAATSAAWHRFTATVSAGISAALTWVRGLPGRAGQAIAGLAGTLYSHASGAAGRLTSAVSDGVQRAVSWVAGLPGRAGSAIAGLAGTLYRAGVDALARLVSAISAGADTALSTVRGIPGRITGALAGLGSLLYGVGSDIAQGLINGIAGKVDAAARKARELASAAKNAITSLFKTASPSRVTYQVGRWVGEGLANGLKASTRVVAAAAGDLAGAGLTPLTAAAASVGVMPLARPRPVPAPWAARPPILLQINATPGTDRARLGREIAELLDAHYSRGGRRP